MKKISLFRTIAILVIVLNILNYFFLAASYTGINVRESATFFDYTFINYENIDGHWHVLGAASDNAIIYTLLVLLIDIYLLYVLIFRTPRNGDYLSMPYKRIYGACAVGMLFHMFLFMNSVSSSSNDETYFHMIGKGMLLNIIWIIGYIVIIEFFYAIKSKKLSYNDMIKTKLNVFDIVVIGLLIELVLSFFYTSLVNRLIVTREVDGVKRTALFGRLFLSQFTMLFKPKNYYGLDGKLENYPYMAIVLILIFIQIAITIIRIKFRKPIVTLLSIINIVILTIGLIDMCDSIYPNYIKEKTTSFFSLVGVGYYFIIGVNIAILGVNLYSIGYIESVVIGVNEIEDIVNNDTKKNYSNNTENVYIINEKIERDDQNEKDV